MCCIFRLISLESCSLYEQNSLLMVWLWMVLVLLLGSCFISVIVCLMDNVFGNCFGLFGVCILLMGLVVMVVLCSVIYLNQLCYVDSVCVMLWLDKLLLCSCVIMWWIWCDCSCVRLMLVVCCVFRCCSMVSLWVQFLSVCGESCCLNFSVLRYVVICGCGGCVLWLLVDVDCGMWWVVFSCVGG